MVNWYALSNPWLNVLRRAALTGIEILKGGRFGESIRSVLHKIRGCGRVLGAFQTHALDAKPESQRPLFCRTCCWHRCVLRTLTITETIRHRPRPKCAEVKRQDFFKVTDLPSTRQDTVVIGNPPFGKRGKLAIAFFNHAAHLADIVAFIVPVNFRKFTTHKQLEPSMRLISKLTLPRDAFYLHTGKSYSVNTEFQIWTRLASTHQDMRQYKPLPIRHQDFQMWQYNNTREALKVFETLLISLCRAKAGRIIRVERQIRNSVKRVSSGYF